MTQDETADESTMKYHVILWAFVALDGVFIYFSIKYFCQSLFS